MKKLILFSSLTMVVMAALSFTTWAENEETAISTGNVFIRNCERGPVVIESNLGEDDDPLPIRGRVQSAGGGGLQNVHVALYTPELNFVDDDYTDLNGDYQIPEIVPDTYKLYFNKTGYEELIKTIVVVGGGAYYDVGTSVLVQE